MENKTDRLEAIIDAIMTLHEYHKPDSECYRLRNPLMLKSFSKVGKHEVNENGVRIFSKFLDSYHSAVFDITCKVLGRSNSGIKKTDLLRNLLGVYGINQDKDQTQIVSFLKKALQNPDISLQTPLSYFAEVK